MLLYGVADVGFIATNSNPELTAHRHNNEAQSAIGPSLLGVRRSGTHCLTNCVSRLSAAEIFVAR